MRTTRDARTTVLQCTPLLEAVFGFLTLEEQLCGAWRTCRAWNTVRAARPVYVFQVWHPVGSVARTHVRASLRHVANVGLAIAQQRTDVLRVAQTRPETWTPAVRALACHLLGKQR